MAAAIPPAGLLDIASTLVQDEIPFKLRCAICNELAVNAFRLPCCDQSICETCQTSLPETCSVCAHTPVSPDLCKPNKALRTTLKVFLRTEEKKREKERQSAVTPTTPVVETPTQTDKDPAEATPPTNGTTEATPQPSDAPQPASEDAGPSDQHQNGDIQVDGQEPDNAPNDEPQTYSVPAESMVTEQQSEPTQSEEAEEAHNGEDIAESEAAPSAEEQPKQPNGNMTNMGQGAFPGMGWNGMNPFMSNMPMANMFNFQSMNSMSIPMNPMAANQGMFGDYGMNMAGTGMGMGMGMGMNYNGQNMYGSSGWDGSWQSGQDNYNPTAFANGTGTGPQHRGAFGGPNMPYSSNSDFQPGPGYYGSGYGRGGFQGSGRGGFRGYGSEHPSHGGNQENFTAATGASDGATDNATGIITNGSGPHTQENGGTESVSEEHTAEVDPESGADASAAVGQTLQGIPTIEALDQAQGMSNDSAGWQDSGYSRAGFRGPVGRGMGYWNGQMYQAPMPPKAPIVEGAPAAPRGMRQGLPNTSMLRQRAFQHSRNSGGGSTSVFSQSGTSEPSQEQTETSSVPPTSQEQATGSKSRSSSQNRTYYARSQADVAEDVSSDPRERNSGRSENSRELRANEPQLSGSKDREDDRSRRDEHRSRRGGRRPPVNESKHPDDSRSLADRVSSRRSSRERSVRREDDRTRDRETERARPSRRRDRGQDRGQDRERERRDRDRDRERDRGSDRDRRRDRERERERDRDRDRDRGRGGGGRERESARKRSRRDRSESANASDPSSHPRARRVKRETDSHRGQGRSSRQEREPASAPVKEEKEKDPYTLAREAANRERLLREQQNRGGKSQPKSSRRGSRQERLVGGRRINYKYEDEL